MKNGNVIKLNLLHLNSCHFNGTEKVQKGSAGGGSIVIPPPTEPDIPPTYTLSASVTNGMVSAKRNGSAVNLPFTANEGDVIVVEVTPNDGYEFNGWADGNTDNPRTIVVNEDITLNASCKEVFVPLPTYTLSASVVNGVISAILNGKAISLPYEANEGDVIVLSVQPNDGYTFEGWADGVTDNPRTITMTADVALSAQCVEVVVPPAKDYIQFEDAEVERILMSKGVSSDGVGITMEDAEKVTSISTWFKGNTAITSFNELRYFTRVTSLDNYALQNCSNLVAIDLSNIVSIGAYSLEGIAVNEMILSEGFTEIKLRGASKIVPLTKVDLPSTTTAIGDTCFVYCENLVTAIVRATTPPSLVANAFGYGIGAVAQTPIAKGTGFIYVPDASLEAYKTATNWSSYADRIHPLSEIEGSLVFYDKLVGDGTAYINTEYYPTSWDNVEWDADAPSVYNKYIFGCKSSVLSVANLVYSATQTYYNYKPSTSATTINEDNTKRQRRTLRIVDLGDGSYRREVADLDSEVVNVIDAGWSGKDVVATNALRVFCSTTSAGANEKFYKGAIRSLVITDAKTGNTIMSLKPCTFAGEAGMWDEVNGKFYGNAAASGEFSVAND